MSNYHIPLASGKILDKHGMMLKIKRKKVFFFFKESDINYRKRLLKAVEEWRRPSWIN